MFKKIIIYGEDWQGTLPRLLTDELTLRGYEVTIFDFTKILPGIRKRNFIGRFLRVAFEPYYKYIIRSKFLLNIQKFKPDLVIVCKGYHLNLETLLKVKVSGAKIINWNPDDFFNRKNSCGELIKSMGAYDAIASSRPQLFEKYRTYGAKNLIYLDWYYVPNLHYFQGKVKNKYLISFVGSWSPLRENFISKINARVNIWGGGWEKSSKKFKSNHNVSQLVLSQPQMSRVFAASKFNLNLLTKENSDISNLRFFEVTASGGLLLTERNDHAMRHLEDRKECLMFKDAADINQFLKSDFNFDIIAKAGQRRIISDSHTFSNRVDLLFEKLISK